MGASLAGPAGFGLLSLLAAGLGALALALRPDWTRAQTAFVSLVSAGLLLAFTLLDILPAAVHAAHGMAAFALVGYLTGLFASLLTGHRHAHTHGLDVDPPVLAILIGIGLHSALDGVVYAVTHEAHATSGLFAALGLTAHKLPVAALTFGLLCQARIRASHAFILTVMAVGVMAPLGMLAANPLLHTIGGAGLGALFAFSAGILLFVATGPLLAHGSGLPRGKSLVALVVGVAIGVTIVLLSPHEHLTEHLVPDRPHFH